MTEERVIVLVDMDCFYCQVEELLNPQLIGKPVAVVPYNAWKGGGILAVNYIARDKGVTRHMRGDDAKAKYPEINLVVVPPKRGKSDISRYRAAGKKVAEVLQNFTSLLERASVDEAYLDITETVRKRMNNGFKVTANMLPNSHIIGFSSSEEYLEKIYSDPCFNESNLMLAIGGVVAEEIRAAVLEKTGYRCSAGIAHNKILAKVVCGLHKPNQQTILPFESIGEFYQNLGVKKLRGLGGKFGDELMGKLKISKMGQLAEFTEAQLMAQFDAKSSKWLYNIARGIDLEPVTVRLVSKSIGCCKQFRGKAALKTENDIKHWLKDLSLELMERVEEDMEENNRKPKAMTVNYAQKVGRKEISSSKSLGNINCLEVEKLASDAYEIIRKNCQHTDASFFITFLGLNIGKFESLDKTTASIADFFKNMPVVDKTAAAVASTSKKPVLENKRAENTIENQKEAAIEIKNVETTTENQKVKVNLQGEQENEEEEELTAELESITCEKPNETNSSSFFHKFIDENIPQRDFNTSLILEENSSENSNSNSNDTEADETEISDTVTLHDLQEPENREPTSDNYKQCDECKKQIRIEEFASHIDYHFALKIVKEEAHLYKPKEKEAKNTPQVKKKVGKKRKQANSTSSSSLRNFFVAENDTSEMESGENLDTCPDCSKRFKIEEFPGHMDFHIAKKLHLEINGNGSTTASICQTPKVDVKQVKFPKNKKTLDITSFFTKL